MELIHQKIKAIWDQKMGVNKPPVLYALDSNNKLYVIAREQRTIVTLVVKYGRKIYTYVIPKVYLDDIQTDTHVYYKLKNASKLSIISCSNSQIDEMANFVAMNIINKI